MKPLDHEGSTRRIPSQADIAAAAQVSTATVSRVVNNSSLVSPALRERVLAEMDRLGYYPHGAARALAYNKSWTIGAVIPTIDNDLFARGIGALMKRLREMDYSLMVVSSDYSLADEANLVRRLLERGVDGLFLIGQERLPETRRLLERSGRPYVESYISDDLERENNIGFSNFDAGFAGTRHLVELGHHRIAMLAGIGEGNDRARQRLAGYRACLEAHGLAVDESLIHEVPYEIDAARVAFGSLVEQAAPPTALMCGNDLIAMGVLFEARALGISIPERLSVVGVDNHPLSRHAWPPLTTIDIPAIEIGRLAAERLVDAIEHGTAIGRHALDAPLIVRGTTAAKTSEA